MKFNKGTIEIDISELVEAMTPEQKRAIAMQLGAEEYLIRATVESLVAGGFFEDDGVWWFDDRTLTELRAKLAPMMEEVAREAIRGLLQQVSRISADWKRDHDWAWKLYHAWPEGYWRSRPESSGFVSTPRTTDAEVDAALERAERRPCLACGAIHSMTAGCLAALAKDEAFDAAHPKPSKVEAADG